ncbi:site-specific DNA-methyltransferase [Marilutibacter spongiae]|uniref:Methyltransferase n=1 Tax=Marilutibacter spongiae TaxID=2025720 RepID=A0A7W3TMB1_9GAMM|nr:site-specific DNA-methyltransferase [Lysobacter spongiae]MBB1060589.1 site-specific DNA-methyltransferase [Lysobacter spongiae]
MPWLEWHNRNDDLKATAKTPYRLLQPIQSLSHGDEDAPNMLIQGDNLEALKALLPYYAGQVKCIFIDPPYNTKSAFEHYDDNLEHAQWLSMMYPRMVLLRELLSEDGSIWITLDDNEAHYFKVMCDEVFGRKNFLGNIVWNHSVQSKGYSGKLSVHHNHVLGYRKSDTFELLDLPRTDEHNVNYSNPDNDPRGPWRSGDVRNSLVRRNLMYDIKAPGGNIIKHPPKGWRFSKETYEREREEGKIIFSADETRIIRKIYLADQDGRVPETLWFAQDVGTTREANKEVRAFVEGDFFETPKPERLIERILRISSKPGDLILDSFIGSGTTGAVAHKMGRRWIGVEVGEHAKDLAQPRLRAVVDGEQGGISEAVGWQGGGGFRFYQLGPKVFDDQGRINPDIKFEHLAAHIWFAETGTARSTRAMKSPLLGVHNGTAYYLLYNGILGDKTLAGGNMLTMKVLAGLPKHDGPMVIYGEGTNMTNDRLRSLGIKFKKTPNDIRAR